MGVWNVEDLVTGLPIVGNDKVKFLLLTETGNSKNSREFRNKIFPRCVPLTGYYNEYGTIHNVEKSLNNEFVIQQFEQDYIGNYKINTIENIMEVISNRELFVDENFFQRNKDQEHLELINGTNKLLGKHDKQYLKDKTYIADLESRIKDTPVSKVKVWPAFVLESIYNKLLNYNFKVNGKSFKKLLLDDAFKFIDSLPKYKFNDTQLFELKYLTKGISRNLFINNLYYYYKDSFSLGGYEDFIEKLIESGDYAKDSKEIIELVNEIVDFICFNKAFHALRKQYHLPNEYGNQESNYKIHQVLAETVLEHCKSNKKKHYSYE